MFYEMQCNDWKCRARLQYGARKNPKGALYPKRRWDILSDGDKTARPYEEKDCNKGYCPNNGWFIWKPKEDKS